MRIFGAIISIVSFFLCIIFVFMRTSVETPIGPVANLSLMQYQTILVTVTLGLFIAGILMFSLGEKIPDHIEYDENDPFDRQEMENERINQEYAIELGIIRRNGLYYSHGKRFRDLNKAISFTENFHNKKYYINWFSMIFYILIGIIILSIILYNVKIYVSHNNEKDILSSETEIKSEFGNDHSEITKKYAVSDKIKKENSNIIINSDGYTIPQIRLGECQERILTKKSHRLGNNKLGSGSLIEAGPDVMGVAYEELPEVDRSQVGDKLTVCLISKSALEEYQCPPDTVTGWEFQYYNQRTNEKWEMPNSSHVC